MKIYQNAFYVPSIGKYFSSWSSHDFVGYKFEDGRSYYVDGGLSYYRTIGNFELEDEGKIVSYRLDDKSSIKDITEKLLLPTLSGRKLAKDLTIEELTKLVDIVKNPRYGFDQIVLQVIEHYIKLK